MLVDIANSTAEQEAHKTKVRRKQEKEETSYCRGETKSILYWLKTSTSCEEENRVLIRVSLYAEV